MIAWFRKALSQWKDFGGRARRSEYWYYTLTLLIVYVVLAAIIGGSASLGEAGKFVALVFYIVYIVIALAFLVPSIAVAIRRMHDTGRSGWWLLISLVPFVGGIAVLVLLCLDSQPMPNKWGPNPKALGATTAPSAFTMQ
jgi:uncharacterized membrane protein YhaH (DUF805 family)